MTGEYESPEARRYGFPAVNGHEVVAVSCVSREDWDHSEPGHVCLIRWHDGGITSEKLPSDRLYVWVRAGRVSFVANTGESVDLTLLGEHEYTGLGLGAPWPSNHKPGTAANVAAGVAHDLKNTITFPTSFPRMMHTSNERNDVVDALVGWCQREMPDMHVLRGGPRSQDRPSAGQIPALPHKGLIGDHGWLDAPAGAEGLSDSIAPPGAGPVERNQH
jgi:hypothetical protein